MSIILHDTHFHLDLFENPRAVLSEIEQKKIYTIAVTNIPDVFEHTETLVKESKYVRAALGFHPELSSEYSNQLAQFKKLVTRTRYIGEVGLDNYSKSPTDFAQQKRVFEQILLACHDEGNKILTVHSRRAATEVITMIGAGFSGKIILHWFSGSQKEMELAIKHGCYFSINLAMTLSENGRKIVNYVPKEKILLETDGPFVTVDNHPCTPSAAAKVVNNIESIWKNTDAAAIIANNFKTLLQ